VGQGKRERRKPSSGRSKMASGEGKTKVETECTEDTDSGWHHPAIEDGENSCSLRESRSLRDINGWLKEWQC